MVIKKSDYGQQYKEYTTQAAGDKALYSRRSGARWRALVQLSAVPQPVCKAASVLPVFVILNLQPGCKKNIVILCPESAEL